MKFLVPVAIFAAGLAVLEWLGNGRVSMLPLRTVAVAALSVWAARRIPWGRIACRVPPRSRRFQLALFLLFTAHFVETITVESRRMLTARALCLERRFGPGWFDSLKWAVVGVFRRALVRAERFYAAQWMKGLG